MDAVTIDPRQLAATLGVDLLTLEQTFREWAREAMYRAMREAGLAEDLYADGDDLDRFDPYVTEARAHLEAAIAVGKAWREDNPDAFTED
jgi:hypothetical protein